MSEQPHPRVSRWGIGPLWTVLSLAYGLGIYLVDRRCFPDLEMIWPPVSVGWSMALLLLGAGIVIYVAALRRLREALRQGRLATEGVYAWMRHPVYSAFIMFIVPAVVLVVRSVLALTVPVAMYILFRILIRREETPLAERFGEQYRQWRRRTNAILPAPPIERPVQSEDDAGPF